MYRSATAYFRVRCDTTLRKTRLRAFKKKEVCAAGAAHWKRRGTCKTPRGGPCRRACARRAASRARRGAPPRPRSPARADA
eukprot:1753722-Pleurochrysis_carterae.AAC.1